MVWPFRRKKAVTGPPCPKCGNTKTVLVVGSKSRRLPKKPLKYVDDKRVYLYECLECKFRFYA